MALSRLARDEQWARTGDGWQLRLVRSSCPDRLERDSRPLLIVPGYGMNSFIFSYHPRGTSMTRALAEAGFEVWTVDLRGQGPSRPTLPDQAPISLAGYVEQDLPAAIEHVLEHSAVRRDALALLGASLGGSIAFAYLALHPAARVAGVVAMGAPLRWNAVHPLVRTLFSSELVASSLRFRGTERWIRALLPVIRRVPRLLWLYMNAATIDLDHLGEMVQTVADPQPVVNRELVVWIRERDLVLRGVNVTTAMREQRMPLLVVLSNRDGVVPDETALSAVDHWGGEDVEVLRVGTDDDWYAHANLFVGNDAPLAVFDPLATWLRRVVG
jgi:pimeloyl-ACP methyl ester carboxylesterase